ncbi:hypothetical protein bAD24_I04205 [Burkholderia sp. AD24]|nr:hypothetical protein bAD24_I04205 [Burkholderia sp. AD24]
MYRHDMKRPPFLHLSMVVFSISICFCADAATLITFSAPELVVIQNGGEISGFWGSTGNGFSCKFLFNSTGPRTASGQFQPQSVQAFSFAGHNYQYSQRLKDADTTGTIYVDGDQWALQLADEPPGCGSGSGSFVSPPVFPDGKLGPRYVASGSMPAVGIRVVSEKADLYDKVGDTYRKRKSYLVNGDMVVILSDDSNYARVRYVNPLYSASTYTKPVIAWVQKKELIDPFQKK